MEKKITITTKIVVNGKEYRSVEDLPPDVRPAYEFALSVRAQGKASPIVFNGQSYDGPDAMPPEIRQLYEAAMANLPKPGPASPQLPPEAGGPVEPGGVSPRFVTALLIGAIVLALWYWYRG